MTTKLATILTQFADTRERKNLKATTIGEHWFVKTIELVQTSRSFQHIKSWTEIEMIRVSEDDLGFHLIENLMSVQTFHRAKGTNGHEDRSFDGAVICGDATSTRSTSSIGMLQLE